MALNLADKEPRVSGTSTWMAELDRRGFAIIPAVFTEQEISSVLRELEVASSTRSRAGVRHCLGVNLVGNIARDFRLLGIAQRVLGPDALPFRATLFDKSPDANWLVVWHQDTGLPLQQQRSTPGWGPWSVKQGVIYAHAPEGALRQIVALRIHLDDSLVDNGPLRVLPGTHVLGILGDDSIEELTTQIVPHECVASRGQVLAMRPLLVHSSSKSRTGTSRRVLHIEYAASAKIEDGLELAIA